MKTVDDVIDDIQGSLRLLREVTSVPSAPIIVPFSEGDLVKSRGLQSYKGGTHINPPQGHVGVVRLVDPTPPSGETILVEWASPWDGHMEFPIKTATGWWMHPDNLEPA